MKALHIVWLAVALALTGCFDAQNMYGRIWYAPASNDAGFVSIRDIQVPPNAPSISNSYFRSADVGVFPPQGHLGVDFLGQRGTAVIAPADGRVIEVFTEPLYGNNLVVAHGPDENGRPMFTHYKHLDSIVVAVGNFVKRGQRLGGLGNTGVLAGGLLHLHFEVQQESRTGRRVPVDPNLYWLDGPGQVTCFEPTRAGEAETFRITDPVACR